MTKRTNIPMDEQSATMYLHTLAGNNCGHLEHPVPEECYRCHAAWYMRTRKGLGALHQANVAALVEAGRRAVAAETESTMAVTRLNDTAAKHQRNIEKLETRAEKIKDQAHVDIASLQSELDRLTTAAKGSPSEDLVKATATIDELNAEVAQLRAQLATYQNVADEEKLRREEAWELHGDTGIVAVLAQGLEMPVSAIADALNEPKATVVDMLAALSEARMASRTVGKESLYSLPSWARTRWETEHGT